MTALVKADGTAATLTTANAYQDVAGATAFFGERPSAYAAAWTGAGSTDQTAALIWAARLLDEQIDWAGYRVSRTQLLRWPRYFVYDRDGYAYDSNAIPTWLPQANAVLAAILLANGFAADPIYGFSSIGLGSIQLAIDKGNPTPVLAREVMSLIPPSAGTLGGGGGGRKLVRA